MPFSAIQAYHNAYENGRLPAVIPVEHPDGTIGLLTGSTAISPEATPSAFSDDDMERAGVAIQVCSLTRQVAQERTILRPTAS